MLAANWCAPGLKTATCLVLLQVGLPCTLFLESPLTTASYKLHESIKHLQYA